MLQTTKMIHQFKRHGTDTKLPAPNSFSSVLSHTFDSETEVEEEVEPL
jgi:hypothetical protein